MAKYFQGALFLGFVLSIGLFALRPAAPCASSSSPDTPSRPAPEQIPASPRTVVAPGVPPTALSAAASAPADSSAIIQAADAPAQRPHHPPVVLPLAFQELDAALLGLNEEQEAAIAQIRARFLAEIGGAKQDPSDPLYLQKWQQAQPECDALFSWKLGRTLYQQAQLQAHASSRAH